MSKDLKDSMIEENGAAPIPADEKPAKEKKEPLRKRFGAWLQQDKLTLPPKVKKVAVITGGTLVAAGAAVGGILLKQHMGDDGVETDPVGLLPEGEAPFELPQEDFAIEDVAQT